MTKAIIEVGVNTGQDVANIYGEHWKKGYKYYGFEPVPFLAEVINKQHGTRPGFELIQDAVDVDEEPKNFNIQNISNMSGVSSLYEINEEMDPHFKSPFFKYSDTTTVNCKRMDSFIEEKEITEVVYLHSDAQGNDINVLKSFGDHLDKLKAGVVEASKDEFLYTYKENSQENIEKFLVDNGFEVTEVKANDSTGLEVNIHFVRK